MKKEKILKNNSYFTHIKTLIGIILILVSIFGLINYGYGSTLLVYSFAFLFGNFYFAAFAVFIIFGISLVLGNFIKNIKPFFYFIGLTLLFISILISSSLFIDIKDLVKGTELNFSNFSTVFLSQLKYNGIESIDVLNKNLGGGYIGFFFCASLNSIFNTSVATITISSIFFSLSLIFLLYKPIKTLILYFSDNEVLSSKIRKKILKKEQKLSLSTLKKEKALNRNNETSTLLNKETVKEDKPIEIKKASDITVDSSIIKKAGNTDPILNNNLTNQIDPSEIDVSNTAIHSKVEKSINVYSDDNSLLKAFKFSENNSFNEPKKAFLEDEKIIDITPIQNDYGINCINKEQEGKKTLEKEKTVFNEITIQENNKILMDENKFQYEEGDSNDIEEEESLDDDVIEELIEKIEPEFHYESPSIDLIKDIEIKDFYLENDKMCRENIDIINEAFNSFSIGASVTNYTIGPSVTRYEVVPDHNYSISGIEKYIDDISIRLNGQFIRFERIVEGKSCAAIELPNLKRQVVTFKEAFNKLPNLEKPNLIFPYGKNINGDFLNGDLIKAPHLLVCGTTGSGKSIFIHSMISTFIMRNSPKDIKFLFIDPKRLELGRYKEIPHLLCPPIYDASSALEALNRLCDEMDNRCSLFEQNDELSDLEEYNKFAKENDLQTLPRIVVVIDEYADLVDTNKGVAIPVGRIAQKARSAGIHLIISTQRPSVSVINGVIKANLGIRIAFKTVSGLDSRVILDTNGAEKLLGNGDALVLSTRLNNSGLTRIQAPYLTKEDCRMLVNNIRTNYPPMYSTKFLNLLASDNYNNSSNDNNIVKKINDPEYQKIRENVFSMDSVSASFLVANYSIGFTKANKFIVLLTKEGIIAQDSISSNKGKKVLVHSQKELDDLNIGETQ